MTQRELIVQLARIERRLDTLEGGLIQINTKEIIQPMAQPMAQPIGQAQIESTVQAIVKSYLPEVVQAQVRETVANKQDPQAVEFSVFESRINAKIAELESYIQSRFDLKVAVKEPSKSIKNIK